VFQIHSYNSVFLGVNSESKYKLSSSSQECLALGLEEELGQLMCLSFPLEAFTFTEFEVKKVSSTAKMLAFVGDT
jgi:hypothetical protein